MGSFDGRVALVTGGAKGIGRGIVEGFLREGAGVAVVDTDAAGADKLVGHAAHGRAVADLARRLAREEGGNEEANVQRHGSFHPLGRIGRPEDVAEAVLFLASHRASFIAGEYLCVDGGFMAQGAWASSAGAED